MKFIRNLLIVVLASVPFFSVINAYSPGSSIVAERGGERERGGGHEHGNAQHHQGHGEFGGHNENFNHHGAMHGEDFNHHGNFNRGEQNNVNIQGGGGYQQGAPVITPGEQSSMLYYYDVQH